MQEKIIKLEGLSKKYGSITALKNVSLEVHKGEVLGLLGPNGSGKTTMINILLGLIKPTKGSVDLFGGKWQPHLLKRVGIIMDDHPFYPDSSGRENLKMLGGLEEEISPDVIDEKLEFVGLADRANSKFRTYSLGMKQRLSIALALLKDPEFLIFDEPTNGMDPAGISEIRNLIKKLGAEGKTIFLASHLLNEVEQVCESVAIIKKGKIIVRDNIGKLLSGSSEITLKTSDNARALSVLNGCGFIEEITQADESILLRVDEDKVLDVSKTLAEAGIYILGMESKRNSLESFFMEVTEN